MASEYQLKLLYKAEFHDIYAEHSDHREFGPLLRKMKVVDEQGESQMDEDQWEAASELSESHFTVCGRVLKYSFFRRVYWFRFRESLSGG
jgi:hypothetical protein